MPTEQPKQDELLFKSFDKFSGLNTGELPSAIADDEQSMLVNLMPIGNSTLKKIYSYSSDLVTVGAADIKRMFVVNINDVISIVCFLQDGSAWNVNIATWSATQICPIGTLVDPKVAQWQSDRMLVIDVNGYFSWDGATWSLISNGAIKSIQVHSSGPGGVSDINIWNGSGHYPGQGYVVGDILSPVQSGGSGCTCEVMIIVGGGAIVDVNLLTSGSGYHVEENLLATGGSGVGALLAIYAVNDTGGGNHYSVGDLLNIIQEGAAGGTFLVTSVDAGGAVITFELQTGGSGYSVASNLQTSYYSGSGLGSGCTVDILSISNVGLTGTSIAVYKGRVWIGNNRTIVFSAPDSFTDFTTESGGGSFLMSSPNLRQQVVGMLELQDFLYVFGDHNCSIIAGVTLSSQSPTSFTILETFSHEGLQDYDSLQVLDNIVFFSNETGLHAMSGTTQKRIHEKLDGLMFDGNFPNVGVISKIYDIDCYGWLAKVFNIYTAAYEKWIFFFFPRKEKTRVFAVNYGLDFNFICSVESTSGSAVYGSYGNKMVKLFDPTSVNPITSWIRTRSEDFGLPINDKQTMKLGLRTSLFSASNLTFTASIVSDYPFSDTIFSVDPLAVIWSNKENQVAAWENNSQQTVTWSSGSYPTDVLSAGNFSGRGKKILIDLKEASSDIYILQSIYYEGITRARW